MQTEGLLLQIYERPDVSRHHGASAAPIDGFSAPSTRILNSAAFAHAGRLGRFLRFVVQQARAGRGDQIKEYVVGIEVFDRPGSFDPRSDSIVRVEARRLRAKLQEYYEMGRTMHTCDVETGNGSGC